MSRRELLEQIQLLIEQADYKALAFIFEFLKAVQDK